MKSSLKILIISILIILIGVSSYFIFFKREKISENLNSLTVFEKMTFSDNEKEIFDMLGELKENLLKGEEKKEITDMSDFNMSPTESIFIKEFCPKIYEIKKYEDSVYIIDMDMVIEDKEPVRKKVIVSNGKITMFNVFEEDYKTDEQNTDENSLENSFLQMFIAQINSKVLETWEKATTLDNVNYEKVYKLI